MGTRERGNDGGIFGELLDFSNKILFVNPRADPVQPSLSARHREIQDEGIVACAETGKRGDFVKICTLNPFLH